MKIYLDNCCFNRPYDDQSDFRVRLEAEAKLKIQEEIRNRSFRLVWSYLLSTRIAKTHSKKEERIAQWRKYAVKDIVEDKDLLEVAVNLQKQGIKKIDSPHIACTIDAEADYFLTTDDGILRKAVRIQGVRVDEPIGFIK